MILVVDAINRHKFEDILEEMFRLRARVFGERLGCEPGLDGRNVRRTEAAAEPGEPERLEVRFRFLDTVSDGWQEMVHRLEPCFQLPIDL